MVSLKQIHSRTVLIAGTEGCIGEGDALVTSKPGLIVSVRTADCFPILLADPVHRTVAAIHAGWRGTASGICIEAVESMRRHFDTDPAHIVAAIGPGIGACCYEVGEDVARQFGLHFNGLKSGLLDLAAENRRQLEEAGIAAIEELRECTFCHPEHFYSWRRDRDKAARMISCIGIRS